MIKKRPIKPIAAMTPSRCLFVALAFFLAMLALGSVPGKATELSSIVPDKLLHFLAYSLLSVLCYFGLPGGRMARALGTLIAIAMLGAVDEAIQELLPYRNANLRDWQFDMLAASVCVACLAVLQPLYLALASRRQGRRAAARR